MGNSRQKATSSKCCASCSHWGATEPEWPTKGSGEIWQWCDQKPKAWANRAYVCAAYLPKRRA